MERSLTPQQGQALLDRQYAILDGDILITRTAFYAWDEAQAQWTCTHEGLRVVHNNGYVWHPPTRRFVRCRCHVCAAKDGRHVP